MEGSAAAPPPPPPPPPSGTGGPNEPPPGADPEEFFGGEAQDAAADTLLGEEGKARPTGSQVAGDNGAPDAPAGSDPSPAPEETEEAAEPQPGTDGSTAPVEAPAPPEEPKTPSRVYTVIREVRLTEKLLKALMEEQKKGDEANARVAYFVLGDEDARSVEIALRQSYSKNRGELGPKARLGAIGAKGFRIHDVEPKPVQAERIQIG